MAQTIFGIASFLCAAGAVICWMVWTCSVSVSLDNIETKQAIILDNVGRIDFFGNHIPAWKRGGKTRRK